MFFTCTQRRHVTTLAASGSRSHINVCRAGNGSPRPIVTSRMASTSSFSGAVLPKTGPELTAAAQDLEAREAKIAAMLAAAESQLNKLAEDYRGRSGRRNEADTNKTKRLKDDVFDLKNGEFPDEAIKRRRHERRVQKEAATAAASAASHASHHSSQTDARSPQHSRAVGAAGGSAAGGGGGAGADDAAPDDEEDEHLPEDVDKHYYRVSDVQKAFHDSVLGDVLAGRGGVSIGGGYWRYDPPHFAAEGGAAKCVGLVPLLVYDPQRTFGCPHGLWRSPHHLIRPPPLLLRNRRWIAHPWAARRRKRGSGGCVGIGIVGAAPIRACGKSSRWRHGVLSTRECPTRSAGGERALRQ